MYRLSFILDEVGDELVFGDNLFLGCIHCWLQLVELQDLSLFFFDISCKIFLDHVQSLLGTIEIGIYLGFKNGPSAVPKPFFKACWRSRAIGHVRVLQDIKVLSKFRQLEKLFNFILSPLRRDFHHICFLLKGFIRPEGTNT